MMTVEEKLEELRTTLVHIATMDAYTREGEEPTHVLMARLADESLKRAGLGPSSEAEVDAALDPGDVCEHDAIDEAYT